jgi:predicted DNA binding CopG/RHH family protein
MKKSAAIGKNLQLDAEETSILEAFESGELRSAGLSPDAVLKYQSYAEATFRKDARINIRLSSRDLKSLQKRALEEGIPYQTLISSVLHKYVEGRLQEN